MLVAKTQKAFVHLQRQFRLRQIKKTYLALVVGSTDARDTIEILWRTMGAIDGG